MINQTLFNNSHLPSVLMVKVRMLDYFPEINKWIFLIFIPILSLFGIIGNVLLIFHHIRDLKQLTFSLSLFVLYCILQMFNCLWVLILPIAFYHSKHTITLNLITKKTISIKSPFLWNLFFSFTYFSVNFIACQFAIISFDRFITVFLPFEHSKFRIPIIILLSVSFIISLVSSIFYNTNCRWCPYVIILCITMVLSVCLQLFFYIMISVKISKVKRAIQPKSSQKNEGKNFYLFIYLFIIILIIY